MESLPELSELIPTVEGDVYGYNSQTYFHPKDFTTVTKTVLELGLIRVGYKVYELLDWVPAFQVWTVRPFSCTLTKKQLKILSSRGDG